MFTFDTEKIWQWPQQQRQHEQQTSTINNNNDNCINSIKIQPYKNYTHYLYLIIKKYKTPKTNHNLNSTDIHNTQKLQ